MQINELFHPARIACKQTCSSKKRSLELLSQLLADSTPDLTEGEIIDSLVARERLGSTGLGKGVALPHGRINGLTKPLGALITLESGIDFDSIDNQPVDLLFALLVPEESTEEHLQILARLASLFSLPGLCQQIRSSPDGDSCHDILLLQEQHSLSA
jgi:PTS system nitrogen regulatory IIA component